MKQLNKQTVTEGLSENVTYFDDDGLPERIIQFGEGNFLRGFVDWMVHQMNKQNLFNGKVVAIQPTPHGKVVPKLNRQDGLYTASIRGIEHGENVATNEVITAISRGINPYTNWEDVLKVAEDKNIQFIFSNTTEAGLTYMQEDYDPMTSPLSFPGKVVAFLYHRYKHTGGAANAGFVIMPCELIDGNGDVLKELVLKISNEWGFSEDFIRWVNDHNEFCNTLVDRIVTGYPAENIDHFRKLLGYEDELLTVGEPYHLFAIEAKEDVATRLPFQQAGLNVKWGDVEPYRELKVRLLNGTHTMMFAIAYLAGKDTVLEAMEDEQLVTVIKKGLYEEILPFVSSEEKEKNEFVKAVLERFSNPFNRHLLTDIGMNAIFKFKSRLVPTLTDYIKEKQSLPKTIVFSLAALFIYYRGVKKEGAFLIGKRATDEYVIRDNEGVIKLFEDVWQRYETDGEEKEQIIADVLERQDIWGTNLANIPGLNTQVAILIDAILRDGINVSLEKFLK